MAPALPRPFPEARLLAADEMPPEGCEAWEYAGMLEEFSGGRPRFRLYQRVAWPLGAPWESVRDLGLWMVERLSRNGYLLLGLRARPESASPSEARLVTPPSAGS